RSRQGLPALVINWGSWTQVGMAATHEQRLAHQGIIGIAPEEGLDILGRLLAASGEEQRQLLEAYFYTCVAQVLNCDVSDLNTQHSLIEIGIDSLMALEIRNRVAGDLA